LSKASDCWALQVKWFEWEYQTIQCAALTGGANLSRPREYKKYGAAGGLERCVGILAAKAAKVASICMNEGLCESEPPLGSAVKR